MPNLDDVLKRYRDYGSQIQAPLPPPALPTRAAAPAVPQYVIPNAFQTPPASISAFGPPNSQNSYDAQVAQRFAGQSQAYSDPNSTWHMRSRGGRQFWSGYGDDASGVASFAPGIGLPLGIGLGMFGSGISSTVGAGIDLAGDFFTGNMNRRAQQAQHMHMATGLQQSTLGHVMMGAQESGLGGRGMNLQAAGKLARGISSFGKQEGVSQEDMSSLSRAAGELGFFNNSSNTDQMLETVKKLTKVIGLMGKLTGDPSVVNNLKEIANLRDVGMNINTAVQATEQIDRAARAMGMNRFQAMTSAGAAGMGMFQSAGFTGASGMVQGVGAGALGRMGAAGLDSRQLALAGGVPGLTNMLMQQNLQYMQGPASLMMLSGLTQGAGGEFGLSGGFGKKLMGSGDFTGMLQGGLGNVRSPGQLLQFLGQQRELKSEMAEQLGPYGAQLGQAQMIKNLAGQMRGFGSDRERTMAAASMITGSPERAQTLMRTLGSSEFRERAQAHIEEEQRRLRFAASREAVQARADRTDRRTQKKRREAIRKYGGVFGGGIEWTAEAVGLLEDGGEDASVADLADAEYEELREQDKAADDAFEEETGLERTTHRARQTVLATSSKRIRERVRKMRAQGWKMEGLSSGLQELGGVGMRLDYESGKEGGRIRVREGQRSMRQGFLTPGEETAADMFMGDTALTSGWSGGFFESREDIRQQRQKALTKVRRTGERITEFRRVKENQWQKGLGDFIKKVGIGATSAMRTAAIEYARSLDKTGGAVDKDAMFDHMVKAFAKDKGVSYEEARSVMEKERKKFEMWGMHFIEDSGVDEAIDALHRSEDAAGVELTKMSTKDLEEFRTKADEQIVDVMSELGFADKGADVGDVSKGQKAAFDVFKELSSSDQALAMGIIADQSGSASDRTKQELLRMQRSDPKRYKRLQEAAKKMKSSLGEKDRKRLEMKASRSVAAYGGVKGLEESLAEGESGRGMHRDMKAIEDVEQVRQELEARGVGDTTESGEGATAPTKKGDKAAAALEEQKQMLEQLPKLLGGFPKAVDKLDKVADKMLRAGDNADRQFISRPTGR